jgi:hypothetical protein
MKLQLILLDEATGQPQKVEAVNGTLDMKSPLQRNLYLATINALTPNTDVVAMEDGDSLIIKMAVTPTTSNTSIEAEVYEPDA